MRVAAGNDLRSQGSQIVGTGDVVLAAGNNLTLETAQSTHRKTSVKRSYLQDCNKHPAEGRG
nr:hemagglutinin repeat-containing protein [Xanthomonas oryzae]